MRWRRSLGGRWLGRILVVGLVVVAAPAWGKDDTAALLRRLEASAASVRTLAGSFEQRSRMKLFKQEVRSSGRFAFAHPRRIRWEYVEPDPSTLTVDGERVVLRSPGAPSQTFDLARDQTMRPIFDQLFLWLGSGSFEAARSDYQMIAGGSGEAPTLTLTPKAGSPVARFVARVELQFDRSLLLRRILLLERSGDEKEIRFSKVERNASLPEGAWRD